MIFVRNPRGCKSAYRAYKLNACMQWALPSWNGAKHQCIGISELAKYRARIFKIPFHSLIWRRGQPTWKEGTSRQCICNVYAGMSSSSEDEEAAKESSSPSEWWEDSDERNTDQEESGQDEDTERYGHERGGPTTPVVSRGKQDLKRRTRRKREDIMSSDQEETDQDEDAENCRPDRREPTKVASRGKQERRRKREREPEGRTSSDEEETDQGSTSLDNLEKIEQVTLGDRERERRGTRKKLRGGESSESVPGIIYLSRVPPFMKPHKVKHLLSRYGSVGRVYLKPEGQFSSAESFPEIPCGSGTRLS